MTDEELDGKGTWRAAFACFVASGLITACATGSEQCRRDPVTGSEQCSMVSDSPGEAAATAAASAATWGVVGCTVNGCQPPFTCNAKTKLCERIRCHESTGTGACPPGYSCDPVKDVCK